MSRAEAMVYLQISQAEFRRRQKRGLYRPTRIAENGWNFFSRRALDEATETLQKNKKKPGRPGKNAVVNPAATSTELERPVMPRRTETIPEAEEIRRVFAELEKDEDLVRIVMATSLPPRTVLQHHASWTTLKRQGCGFYVSKKVMDDIAKLKFEGFPARSEGELLAALLAIRNGMKPCASCKRAPRRPGNLCDACDRESIAIELAKAERAGAAKALAGLPSKGKRSKE